MPNGGGPGGGMPGGGSLGGCNAKIRSSCNVEHKIGQSGLSHIDASREREKYSRVWPTRKAAVRAEANQQGVVREEACLRRNGRLNSQ
jgi:hypothetical protein